MLQKCNILETSTYFTHFSGFVNPPVYKKWVRSGGKHRKIPHIWMKNDGLLPICGGIFFENFTNYLTEYTSSV